MRKSFLKKLLLYHNRNTFETFLYEEGLFYKVKNCFLLLLTSGNCDNLELYKFKGRGIELGRKSKRRKRKKQRGVIRSKHELVVTKKRPRSKFESGLIDAANVMYFIVMSIIFINLIKLQISNLSLHVFVLIIFLMVAISVHVLVFGTLLSNNKNGGKKVQKKKRNSSYYASSSSGFGDYSSNDCSSSSDGGGD